ncbi:MAG TPA: CDP-alcohol phosphatidyltransferase family protein, partial [Planctomycetota bacterium]|nr:CDP-alcohol phosphatidyltransferase family protein [Planctomycetota bacterium]
MKKLHLIPVLPTLLTLGNLACGFIAIARLVDALQLASPDGGPFDPRFSAQIMGAAWLIVAAMVFDAFDGRVARVMGQSSAFGTQLDSLADVVSFGLAPALLAKVAYEHTLESLGLPYHRNIVTLLCSLYLMGAALRLARFNLASENDEPHDTFVGLPSPAAAFTVISTCVFVLIGRGEVGLEADLADQIGVRLLRGLPYAAALLGLLMISRVRYVHLFQRYVRPRARASTIIKLVIVGWCVFWFYEWLLFAAALVALGSNLEPRRRHLLGALVELGQLPRTTVLATSSFV